MLKFWNVINYYLVYNVIVVRSMKLFFGKLKKQLIFFAMACKKKSSSYLYKHEAHFLLEPHNCLELKILM